MKEPYPLSDRAVWIFDLDNTLYPSSARLFDQINVLMTQFIVNAVGVDHDHANRLRVEYWQAYGATLTGLVDQHDIDPDDFLHACHQLDLSGLNPDPALARAIRALPGERMIHTNGPRAHAARVLKARGLDGLFPRIVAIEDTSYVPKPKCRAFDHMLSLTGVTPETAVMVEDQPLNLIEPHRRGMATVWLAAEDDDHHDHVHHRIDDLTAFLEQIAPAQF